MSVSLPLTAWKQSAKPCSRRHRSLRSREPPHAVRAMPSSYRYAQISSQKCLVGEPLRYRGQEV